LPGLPPPRPLRRQRPAYKVRPRRNTRRQTKPSWRQRVILGSAGLVLGLFGWAVLARHFAPVSNTNAGRFDAIIVLGYRADSDGNPTPRMLSRVSEAVREYERGVAPRLILSGGPTHHHFVEAQVMARAAEAEGIPRSAIFEEPAAMDTIQNACFSARIMKTHGWHSAEIVSNAYQLPRAAMIFDRLPIRWRIHAAPSIEPVSALSAAASVSLETLKTLRYLVYADWADRCEP
jgi:uncharacterized SAM-binding protein YcdF (DUF218 family)